MFIQSLFVCHEQMCITASQIQWTQDVTKALTSTKERGDKRPLKSLKKKQVCPLLPPFIRLV
jgi:hypothetical protein